MDFSNVKKYLDNIDKNMVPSYRLIVKRVLKPFLNIFLPVMIFLKVKRIKACIFFFPQQRLLPALRQ